ncbi:hypothetical protein SHKM778_00820 [Streptomyces sp. KM77-8]|uniref:non-specific serine/threonine protein kinase n=1 Tax=Streptomyces haneummycinicus TaxID=3074435 RepID=A0AAT9H8L7_9ACTN
MAGLNHHSIVAVYDSGEDVVGGQSVPYIVMEIVEGRTIRELLMNAEAPGPEQALIIVSGVLEALAYSHQHGIVHRDIKPANVIITHNGAVKVMDFGIARALHGASTTMTQTGMVMGTPQYLSPEQALGKAVDYRSDLYATGCLLYELLALRPPSWARRRCRWCTSTSRTFPRLRRRSRTPVRRSWTAWSCAPRQGARRPFPDGRGDARADPVRAADALRPGRPHRHLEHRPRGHARRPALLRGGLRGHERDAAPGHGRYGGDPAADPALRLRQRGRRRLRGPRQPGQRPRQAVDPRGARGDRRRGGCRAGAEQRGGGGDGGTSDKSPSVTQSTKDEKSSESPSDEETEETTDPDTGPGTNPGNGSGGNWDRPYTPSQEPTYTETQPEEPTGQPTATQPTETGGTNPGGTDGGTEDGGTENGGTETGGTADGGADAGGADAGGAGTIEGVTG